MRFIYIKKCSSHQDKRRCQKTKSATLQDRQSVPKSRLNHRADSTADEKSGHEICLDEVAFVVVSEAEGWC